jgi:hypothetical protein
VTWHGYAYSRWEVLFAVVFFSLFGFIAGRKNK